MARMKDYSMEMQRLRERIDFLEREIEWRKDLLKSRTQSLYQLIQKAQDALQDMNEEEDDDGSLHE